MPTDREELDKLRRLKRFRELEARSQPAQTEQPQEQGNVFDNFNPLTGLSLFGVTPEDVGGAFNLAQNVATGAVAKPIAGIAGLRDVASGEGLQGAGTVQDITQQIQSPLSESGQNLAAGLGESLKGLADNPAINSIIKGAKNASDLLSKLGELTGAVASGDITAPQKVITGEPLQGRAETFANVGGAIGQAIPETALEASAFLAPQAGAALKASKIPGAVASTALVPVKAAKEIALKTPQATKSLARSIFTRQSATKQAIAESLANKIGERSTAGFKLSEEPLNRFEKFLLEGKGKAVSDPLEKAAIKQKFDTGVIASIKTATKDDLKNLLKMVRLKKRGKEVSLDEISGRPSDVAGEALLKRYKRVLNENKKSGEAVQEAAEGLKDEPFDSVPTMNSIKSELDMLDIKLTLDDRPIFKDSLLEGDIFKSEQGMIRQLMNRATRTKSPYAHDAHRLKKAIDVLINKTKTGDGAVKNIHVAFTKIRKVVDDSIDGANKKYDQANKDFSETRGTLDRFEDGIGPTITKTLKLGGGERALGVKLRGIMSNILGGENLIKSVQDLESVAKKFGFKGKDNITLQSLFADELDAVFKPSARTGLQGQISQALPTSKSQIADRLVGAGVDKLRGVNDSAAFLAIEKLLKQRLKEVR